MPEIPDHTLPNGILPRLLGTLVDRRRFVKSLMKDPKATPAELAQYDIRQKALKFCQQSHSRFYAKPMAMLVTAKGLEVHPSVGRLCEPIEGTDGARIADYLGTSLTFPT